MGLGSHSLAASLWGRWTSDCQLLGDTAGKGGHSLGYLPHCCPNSKNSMGERALYTGHHQLCLLLESQCMFLVNCSLHSCTATVQTGHQFPLPALRPLWCGMRTVGEPVHVWGWDIDGGSVLSTQLCYESKTALVNSLLLKKNMIFTLMFK